MTYIRIKWLEKHFPVSDAFVANDKIRIMSLFNIIILNDFFLFVLGINMYVYACD